MLEPVELPLFVPREAEPSRRAGAGVRDPNSAHGFQTELHRLHYGPRQATPECTPSQTNQQEFVWSLGALHFSGFHYPTPGVLLCVCHPQRCR